MGRDMGQGWLFRMSLSLADATVLLRGRVDPDDELDQGYRPADDSTSAWRSR